MARFHGVDRFAEKYTLLSPYNYVANNPMNSIDINGDSIWMTEKGDHVTFHVTGKVLNLSDEKIDMDALTKKFNDDFKSAINGQKYKYKTSDTELTFSLDMNFTVAKSMNDVSRTDHLIAIVDDVDYDEYLINIFGTQGVAATGGQIAYVQSNLSSRLVSTMIHEFGHNMGLGHYDKWNSESKNYMSYGSSRNSFTGGQLFDAYTAEHNFGENYFISRKTSSTTSWWGSSDMYPYRNMVLKGQKIPIPIKIAGQQVKWERIIRRIINENK